MSHQVELTDWIPLFRSTVDVGEVLYDIWDSVSDMNTLADSNWANRLTDASLTGVYKNSLVDSGWETIRQVGFRLHLVSGLRDVSSI